MFEQLMEHKALNLPDPRGPDQVNMTNSLLYCLYHRYIGHIIEDCIAFKEWLQRAINEKRINLDVDAVNPDYHMVNVVILRTHSPPRTRCKDEVTWVLLAQVEHKLEAMARQATPATLAEARRVDQSTTWTLVQRWPHLTTPSPWHPQETASSNLTRRRPDPSQRRPPP